MIRRIFFLVLSGALIISVKAQVAAAKDLRKQLIGKHWAGGGSTLTDTVLVYHAFKKYDSKRYQWGSGYVDGFEFLPSDTAITFMNVLCSSESSPISSFDSLWELRGDTLLVDGPYIAQRFRILRIDRKLLRMVQIDWHSKNDH